AVFLAAEGGALRAVVPVRQLPGAAGARPGRLGGGWGGGAPPRGARVWGAPLGPAGGGLGGRAAARGRAVRARPGAPVRGRRRLLRLLDGVAAGHADAVPAGARARPLPAAPPA